MKLKTWPGTLLTLALLATCMLGWSKAANDIPGTTRTANQGGRTAASAEIAGSYDITGTNVDGSAYKGALAIIKRGDVYQFRWNAGQQYDGVGVGIGNVVAVAFTGGADGKGCGVVSYKVLRDGTLDGKWGYWGLNERGTERATHTSGSGLAGNYDVIGSNPDGTQYKARLAITAKGGGYQLNWSNDSAGFGIRQGDTLSVGIGGPRCAFVAYEVKADGTLEGIWGGYGSDQTGTERATKKK